MCHTERVPWKQRVDPWSDGVADAARLSRLFGVVGSLVTLISGAVLLRVTGWFLRDNRYGAELVEPGRAATAMLTALMGVVLGLIILITRALNARWKIRGLLLVSLFGAAVVLVVVVAGMGSYPATTRAVLVRIDPLTGREAWRTTTPASRLHSVRSADADEVIVEGSLYRGCAYHAVAMKISRSSGRLLEVAPSQVTAKQAPPAGFLFEQGRERTTPCSS